MQLKVLSPFQHLYEVHQKKKMARYSYVYIPKYLQGSELLGRCTVVHNWVLEIMEQREFDFLNNRAVHPLN